MNPTATTGMPQNLNLAFDASSKAGDIRLGSNYMNSGGGSLGVIKIVALLGVVFLVYKMGRKK